MTINVSDERFEGGRASAFAAPANARGPRTRSKVPAALLSRMLTAALVQTGVTALLLLAPAGTLAWWRAWAYLAVVLGGTLGTSLGLLAVNEGLLRERLQAPIQQAQSRADRRLVAAMIVAFDGLLVFIALDVFRLGLLPRPDATISAAGLALVLCGWCITYLGMRENAFASPVVKYQKEREQTVVDSGPYGLVRHPIYAGAVLMFVGTPLWLQSYAAALLSSVPIGLLVLRIRAEEEFLCRTLPGYAGYLQRVRFRLVPRCW